MNSDYTKHIEACWKGYRAYGMKKKGGRMVPNCIKSKNDVMNMQQKLEAWYNK
jgi:hypothetical protein